MNKNIPNSISKITVIAISNLGLMIKNCRLERGISQQDLADRLNVSRFTIMAIEKGDPKVAVGAVFEAAYIIGIPLMGGEMEGLKSLSLNLAKVSTVLPKRAPKNAAEPDDDF
jgi:DNA-binding XRE family transcriptional regulator